MRAGAGRQVANRAVQQDHGGPVALLRHQREGQQAEHAAAQLPGGHDLTVGEAHGQVAVPVGELFLDADVGDLGTDAAQQIQPVLKPLRVPAAQVIHGPRQVGAVRSQFDTQAGRA